MIKFIATCLLLVSVLPAFGQFGHSAPPSGNFFVDVARGLVDGHTAVRKFGRNDDIDTTSDPEDIWAGGGDRVYLTSAETIDVASTSANDDAAGTHARTVVLQGLNSAYEPISETITLDGTSTVTSSNSYLRINRAYVASTGNQDNSNDGDITFDPTTSGSGSRQAFIGSGDGQTLIAHYTVPAGRTAYMVGGQLSITSSSGSSGVKEGQARLWKRPENGAWRIQSQFTARSDGTSIAPDINFSIPLIFEEKTDIKWTGEVDNNNTSIYVQYNLLLIQETMTVTD